MKRRKFLANSGTIASVAVLPRVLPRTLRAVAKAAQATDQSTTKSASRISFETSASKYQNTYAGALEVLARNTTAVSGYAEHVLIEGSNYGGIWLECAPHEGLVYSEVRPDVARNNHPRSLLCKRKMDKFPAGRGPVWSASVKFKWLSRLRQPPGNFRKRPETPNLWKSPISAAAAGTRGSAAIVILDIRSLRRLLHLGYRT